jgi:hypothetical protein
MGQETSRIKDEDATGRDLPDADGTVSDEDVKAITGGGRGRRKGGQDHSTEHHELTDPDHGVGVVQDSSDTASDIASISD